MYPTQDASLDITFYAILAFNCRIMRQTLVTLTLALAVLLPLMSNDVITEAAPILDGRGKFKPGSGCGTVTAYTNVVGKEGEDTSALECAFTFMETVI